MVCLQESESAKYIHISPLFWISFPCRSPQNWDIENSCRDQDSRWFEGLSHCWFWLVHLMGKVEVKRHFENGISGCSKSVINLKEVNRYSLTSILPPTQNWGLASSGRDSGSSVAGWLHLLATIDFWPITSPPAAAYSSVECLLCARHWAEFLKWIIKFNPYVDLWNLDKWHSHIALKRNVSLREIKS